MRVSRTALSWVFASLLMVIAFTLAIWSASWINDAADWRAHTYRVLNSSENFVYKLTAAEAANRGYLLFENEEHLDAYAREASTINAHIDSMRKLTADQPAQQARLAALRPVIDEKVAFMQQIIDTRKRGDVKAALTLEQSGHGKALMHDIAARMNDFQEHEQALLEERSQRLEFGMRLLNFGIFTSAFIAVLVSILSARRISKMGGLARRRSVFQGTLLDNVDAAIISTTLDGVITSFNRGAERLLGYRANEVLNQFSPTAFHDSVELAAHAATLTQDQSGPHASRFEALVTVARQGQQDVREWTYVCKDGKRVPVLLTVNPMLDDEGLLMGYLVIARDITERKAAESKIAQTLKELADFKAALDEHAIVATTDAKGVITYANDKFCAISKYARHELIGKTHQIINSGYHAQAFFQGLWQTISSGMTWGGEIRNRAKDGTYYWVSTTIVPFLDNTGKPVQYIAIRTDITARKEAEMALVSAKNAAELANQTKDSFLAIMSHEIRTPLGGMLGMLELLAYTPMNDDQRDTLRVAHDSGRSLLRIVNDILDWSKIEAGKLELEHQPTSVTQLVQSVANTYARVASAKSIVLEVQIDPRLSPAHLADPLRLSQILNNFVSNALKFTNKGRVELRAELIAQESDHERIRFSVKDSGIGMDETVKRRLFQNFNQGRSDTARLYGGTGLGLVICRRLADLMQGEVHFESEEGRGSTFSLTLLLPVTDRAVEMLHDAHAVPDLSPFYTHVHGSVSSNAPIVLVVDDHPTNRKLLSVQLGLLGLRAEAAENGDNALLLWEKNRYAIVITDCHMPKMDGYALARRIRTLEHERGKPRTPIVGWTANALSEETERCQQAGMDEVLIKPTTLPQLKLALAKFIVQIPSLPETDPNPDQNVNGSFEFDFAELDKLTAFNADRVEVIEEFIAQTQSDLAELEAARNQQDLATYTRIAHRMKGASRMVGAQTLAAACLAIEVAAREGRMPEFNAVRSELDRLGRLFKK